MAHALIVEGADPGTRYDIESKFEQFGHDLRCEMNPAYKRATWGRRPEDAQAVHAVMGDLAGRR